VDAQICATEVDFRELIDDYLFNVSYG
jgi:hypothetical protein